MWVTILSSLLSTQWGKGMRSELGTAAVPALPQSSPEPQDSCSHSEFCSSFSSNFLLLFQDPLTYCLTFPFSFICFILFCYGAYFNKPYKTTSCLLLLWLWRVSIKSQLNLLSTRPENNFLHPAQRAVRWAHPALPKPSPVGQTASRSWAEVAAFPDSGGYRADTKSVYWKIGR